MKRNLFIGIIFLPIVLLLSCRQGINDIVSQGNLENAPPVTIMKISSPRLGDIWEPGSTQNIRWEINSEVKNIRIELVKKFNFIMTLTAYSSNDGIYQWNIPLDIEQSHHYRIKIINAANPDEYKYSGEFFIPQN